MIKPTITLNGTSPRVLQEELMKVREALSAALHAVHNYPIHPRDYDGEPEFETAKAMWTTWRDAAAGIIESAATQVREVAEEYRDGASNAHGGIADQLEEKADNVDSWADSLDSYQSKLEDMEFEDDYEGEDKDNLTLLEDNADRIMDVMSNASGDYPEV